MMNCQPDVGTFKQIYDAGTPQLLWTEMVADLETPVATYLKLANSQPKFFLLESVTDGDVRGPLLDDRSRPRFNIPVQRRRVRTERAI